MCETERGETKEREREITETGDGKKVLRWISRNNGETKRVCFVVAAVDASYDAIRQCSVKTGGGGEKKKQIRARRCAHTCTSDLR